MSESKLAFPEVNIPEKKKDKDWYKKFIQAIVGCSINANYDLSVDLMTDCYKYYNGTQGGDEFKFIQEAEDGETLPAMWINYNKIKIKVDVLLGELAAKGFDLDVRTINKDAVTRKMKQRNKLFVQMRMQEVMEELEEIYGLPTAPGGFVPKDEDELKEYMDKGYKETSEIVMKGCLQYLIKKLEWARVRLAVFRDILIVGRGFIKTSLVNGWPTWERLDPRHVVFDIHATDDFLTDTTFVGHVQYMPIADVIEKFELTKEEIDTIYTCKSYSENPTLFNSNHSLFAGDSSGRDLYSSIGKKMFQSDSTGLRVMVMYAEWDDTRVEARKFSEDKYGNQHTKKVKDTEKGDDVEKKTIKTIRKAYLIAGKIVKEEGILKNEIRSCDDPSDTKKSIECIIPNYLDYTGVSKVMQMQGLQKLKDITMYSIQLAMSRAGAKGFVYDTAQAPEGWETEDVIGHLKKTGIAFINSKQNGGIPATFNQFQQLDLTISASVNQYLEISRMIDFEMDAVSGVNDARQGIVRNASLAVGVAQSALNQSNLATEMLFELFNQMTERVFNRMAALVKISFPENKDRYAPIIGDVGVDFLEMDLEMDLDDYGVFVESLPPAIEDRQMFLQTLQQAWAQGQISTKIYLTLIQERDVKVGIAKAIRAIELEEKKQAEQMEAQQQAAMQQQEMAQQSQMQIEDMKMEKSNQSKAFLEGLKGRNMKETAATQAALKATLG